MNRWSWELNWNNCESVLLVLGSIVSVLPVLNTGSVFKSVNASSIVLRSLYNSDCLAGPAPDGNWTLSLFQSSSYEFISLVTYLSVFTDRKEQCAYCVYWLGLHTCEMNPCGGIKATRSTAQWYKMACSGRFLKLYVHKLVREEKNREEKEKEASAELK